MLLETGPAGKHGGRLKAEGLFDESVVKWTRLEHYYVTEYRHYNSRTERFLQQWQFKLQARGYIRVISVMEKENFESH